MPKQLTFLLLLLISAVCALGQELRILEVDSSQFPSVTIKLGYKGHEPFRNELIQLLQDGKALNFLTNADSQTSSLSGRSIYILAENSGNTFGRAYTDFKNALLHLVDLLQANDYLNVGMFSSVERDSLGLIHLSERFSTDKPGWKRIIEEKFLPVKDSLHRVDLFVSTHDALSHLIQEHAIPAKKIFILLSTARNNGLLSKNSNDIISLSKDAQIPVFAINYITGDSLINSLDKINWIAKQTKGKAQSVRSGANLNASLTGFLNDPSNVPSFEGTYDLSFKVNIASGQTKAKIEIVFNGVRQFVNVSASGFQFDLPQGYEFYLIISVGILTTIILLMVFISRGSRRKAKIKQEATENANIPAPKTSEEAPKTPDAQIRTTEIAKTSGLPILLGSFNGRTETFLINKPLLSLGRHENNDFIVAVPTVSGKHALLHFSKDEKLIRIEDLGSTNGTYVNGVKIKQAELKHGDKIKMGETEFTLKYHIQA